MSATGTAMLAIRAEHDRTKIEPREIHHFVTGKAMPPSPSQWWFTVG
jgi:hypothetical protein